VDEEWEFGGAMCWSDRAAWNSSPKNDKAVQVRDGWEMQKAGEERNRFSPASIFDDSKFGEVECQSGEIYISFITRELE